jgi:hypothetical protein
VPFTKKTRSIDKQALVIAEADDAGHDEPYDLDAKWFKSRYEARVRQFDAE